MTDKKNQKLRYEIINEIGIISKSNSGWQKELNRISWDGKEPKYDIRDWSPNHEKMGKGITLNEQEIRTLKDQLLAEVDFLDENADT